jgi:hypothetical protein
MCSTAWANVESVQAGTVLFSLPYAGAAYVESSPDCAL